MPDPEAVALRILLSAWLSVRQLAGELSSNHLRNTKQHGTAGKYDTFAGLTQETCYVKRLLSSLTL